MPIALRRVMARLGQAIGYQVYPDYMAPARPMAMRLKELFAICGITQVIDIGANRGQYFSFLRFDAEFDGPVQSFEPDPDLVREARRRAAAAGETRWRIHECALGRESGRAVFNRMHQSAYNSFRTPLASAAATDPENRILAQFEVDVRRLDDLIPELGDLSRSFVKMDTQGFDLEVLAGARKALAQVPLVQTEVSFRPIYEGMPNWIDSIRAFEAEGFRFADLFNIRESRQNGLPTEGDCILMRPR